MRRIVRSAAKVASLFRRSADSLTPPQSSFSDHQIHLPTPSNRAASKMSAKRFATPEF
jgi:hypothetical protein